VILKDDISKKAKVSLDFSFVNFVDNNNNDNYDMFTT
jgi:hypothetical protein